MRSGIVSPAAINCGLAAIKVAGVGPDDEALAGLRRFLAAGILALGRSARSRAVSLRAVGL
jgi:hypothetical protein